MERDSPGDLNSRQFSESVGQRKIDANELSGLMSSPGLCGSNAYLSKQDDIMNKFLANLKQQKEPKGEQDTFMNSLQFS